MGFTLNKYTQPRVVTQMAEQESEVMSNRKSISSDLASFIRVKRR